MSSDQFEGDMKKGFGRLQDAVGGLVGDDKTQAKGKVNEAAGSIQDTVGKVKSQAQDVVNQAQDKAQDTFGRVEDFAKSQPLPALGYALVAGIVVGFILHGGRKTVYVRK